MQSEVRSQNDTVQAIYKAIRYDAPIEAPVTTEWIDNMRTLFDKLSHLAEEVGFTASDQMLLRSLHFKDLRSRETQISPSHKATFDWLLESSSRTPFAKWLRFQNGIFWIRGKAGSGKSTLMKYLVDHSQTMEMLKAWAGASQLVTASFYFWNAGTPLQKSQDGLFRSLLYEILRQCPDLIRTVCASKSATFQPFENEVDPWTHEELRQAIGLLRERSKDQARFCFFIDGLDEYNGHPDHIVEVLENLKKMPNLKLCVSSRPWNEFVDAFGGGSDLQLALEELTREDIKKYVGDTLETSPHFKALKSKDERSQDLVHQIVDQAQGVFLWVVLVVRSLLNGLRNADRISDLQRRLREFPETLEKYFSHMHFSIEETYRQQTAQAFTYVMTAAEPLSVITFSFLDEEDLGSLTPTPANVLTQESINNRQDEMKRRLNGRCKGLLEVANDGHYFRSPYFQSILYPKVDFLHRAAYDFLGTKDMQQMISDNVGSDFDPKKHLCQAFLAQIKTFDYTTVDSMDEKPLLDILEDLAFYALEEAIDIGDSQLTILNEAKALAIKHGKYFGFQKNGDYEFLEYLAKRGHRLYFKELLQGHPQIPPLTQSRLLCVLLEPTETKYFEATYDLDMIKLFLEHGTSPGAAWAQLLKSLHTKASMSSTYNMHLEIIAQFLRHGADPQHRTVIEETTVVARESGRAADLYKKPLTQTQTASAIWIITNKFGQKRAGEVLATSRANKKSLLSKWFPRIFN